MKLGPQTIARRIRQLEEQMRVQLLISTERGIRLTPRGQELARALSNLDESLYAMTAGVEEDTPEAEARVRVSITNGLNSLFIAPRLREFSRSNPNIHVHTNSILSVNDVRENQTDMMLAFAPPASASDLVVKPLGSLHYRPLASKAYLAAYGPPTPDNLAHHYFLQSYLYESNSDLWGDWNRLVAKGNISHYCDDTLVYALMIRLNLGIGLTTTYASTARDTTPIDLGVVISLPLYGIALQERLRSRPVTIVFDWLCEIFSERNEWFPREFRPNEMPSTFGALNRIFAGPHL
jgi:DNA-binding transcriptional LysR family regulator